MRNLSDIVEQLTRLTNLTSFDARWIEGFTTDLLWSFTRLTNLKFLSYNIMQEASYRVWQKLTKIETLNIRFRVNETALCRDLTGVISTLTNLRELLMQSFTSIDNPFESITEAHSKLTWLRVDHSFVANWTDADLYRLRRLKKFEFIVANKRNYAADISLSLKHLTALESLRSSIPITDAENCSRLTLLERKIFTERDQQILAYLPQLKDLGELKVVKNMEFMSRLTGLERLWLDGGIMGPEERENPILKHITSSKITLLIGVSLHDKVDWQYLSRLESIHELSIMNTSCDHHVLALTNLTNLGFYGMFDQDDSFLLPYLPKLTKLRSVLYGQVTTTAIPVNLSPLTNLEKMDLQICAAAFEGFGCLTNLTHLSLVSDEEDDKTYRKMSYLKNLTKLMHLDLTAVSSDAINYLTALTNLNYLDLYELSDDKELLNLTMMTNLSSLKIQKTGTSMTGIYLPLFTKLHYLTFKGASSAILSQLPNLVML